MIWATARLLLTFGRARWYFDRQALLDLALPHPEALTSGERRRLQHYFYGGTYLHSIAGALHGRMRLDREKLCLTNLAALAYFFDDLVDAYRHRDDPNIQWQNDPEAYGRVADDERQLAIHFLQNVYRLLPPAHVARFREVMHEVFNIETAGHQVVANSLDLEALSRITLKKGGGSVLLFRLALSPTPTPQEAAAWRQFGALIQLCDDVFDLYFDHRDGIQTVATYYFNDIKKLTEHFEHEVRATRDALDRTALARGQVREARCVVHYVVSITRICLRHYAQVARQHSGQLPLDDRPTMIVDMERWPNRLRTAFWLAFVPM
jgi:hypothetical protein